MGFELVTKELPKRPPSGPRLSLNSRGLIYVNLKAAVLLTGLEGIGFRDGTRVLTYADGETFDVAIVVTDADDANARIMNVGQPQFRPGTKKYRTFNFSAAGVLRAFGYRPVRSRRGIKVWFRSDRVWVGEVDGRPALMAHFEPNTLCLRQTARGRHRLIVDGEVQRGGEVED